MITITRENNGWRCTIKLDETPAKYYAVRGSGIDNPHVVGEGSGPQAALDDALRNLGLETILNPTNAGRTP